MTSDASSMPGTLAGPWHLHYRVEMDSGTAAVGKQAYDHAPTDQDIQDLQDKLLRENRWAVRIRIHNQSL